jgi:hypothetical protein
MNDDEVALSLWLDELNIAKETTFQKVAIGSDLSMALELFQTELNNYSQALRDKNVATIFNQASDSDANILEALRQEEAQAAQDHAMAVRLSQSGKKPKSKNDVNSSVASSSKVDTLSCAASSSKVDTSKVDTLSCAASSSKDSRQVRTCVACMKDIENCSFKKFPCSHVYCDECFTELVNASLSDISLIPIRCCKKDAPQEWVVSALLQNHDGLSRYLEVRESQSTSYVAKILDPEYEKTVIDLGLKVCPKCRRGVEKSDGCIHITCLCRHEFCYTCGANWIPTRECTCDLYPESEINRILNDRPELNARERLNLENALRNHDRHNHSWSRIMINNGKCKKCQSCPWICNQWYWVCNGCHERRCGRCTRNRD